MQPEAILDESTGKPTVRGYLHRAQAGSDGLVLTHGAGSNCNSPLLVALAESLSAANIAVLRCDLPFRQARPHGPPLGSAELDQAGLLRAIELLGNLTSGRIFLGGHSYGGRMATMLAANGQADVEALLLLSYPLHPPRKPQQLRTSHFPNLHTKALFVHGTRDGFGSVEEMRSALSLIPAQTRLVPIEGGGHELATARNREAVTRRIAEEFAKSW